MTPNLKILFNVQLNKNWVIVFCQKENNNTHSIKSVHNIMLIPRQLDIFYLYFYVCIIFCLDTLISWIQYMWYRNNCCFNKPFLYPYIISIWLGRIVIWLDWIWICTLKTVIINIKKWFCKIMGRALTFHVDGHTFWA